MSVAKPTLPLATDSPATGSSDTTLTARWCSGHALGMLAALTLSVWSELPWVLAIYALGSFAVYTLGMRRRWTHAGNFGAANCVTAFRLLLAVSMLTAHTAIPAPGLAALGLLILLLDGVDGRLARSRGTTGLFGATYDVEVDAFYTAALTLLLVVIQDVGPWVGLVGAWRYAYILVLKIAPPRRAHQSSTPFGRWSYALAITCLSCALVVSEDAALYLGVVALVTTSLSFLTSFWQRYA